MKSLLLMFAFCLLSVGVWAQDQSGTTAVLDQAAMDAVKKDKEKSDQAITDEKAAGKASTWMERAKTYQGIAGQYIRLDSAAATKSMEAYNKVIELDKNKKGELGRLAKEAQEALTSQQMYAAFMQQGVAKFQNKNYGEAIKSMSKAGEINPKDTLAPLYTAIAAQQMKDNATAQTELEKYITAGGRDATIYGSLAQLYRSDNKVDQALATLDKGIALDPANKDLANEKINIMLAGNRMDEAIAGMKQMVEKDPKNVQNLVNLSIVYNNIAAKMKEEMSKLSGQGKKKTNTAKQFADSKSILDAYAGELTRLNGAIKKQPKNADLKRQLAELQKNITEQKATYAQLETDMKAEAASASSAAGNEQRVAELKQTYDQQKGMEKEYLLKALAVDPNSYDANYSLGVYYFNEGADLNQQLSDMDIKDYQAKGKEVEGVVCGKFKQALPYFLKAKSIKDEPELEQNLTTAQNLLKQYEEKKVVCVENK